MISIGYQSFEKQPSRRCLPQNPFSPRRYWEYITDRCCKSGYEAAQRQPAPKLAND